MPDALNDMFIRTTDGCGPDRGTPPGFQLGPAASFFARASRADRATFSVLAAMGSST